jgi:adhesin transport system membrane fusion protein
MANPISASGLRPTAPAWGRTKPVLPGMVAQVDIMTGRQTILSYLLKPLRRVRDNALRQ